MPLGHERHANQQIHYPVPVYEQVNNISIKAWKSLSDKGEGTGNITKVIQGPMEPFLILLPDF